MALGDLIEINIHCVSNKIQLKKLLVIQVYVTETWLNDLVMDSEIEVPGYMVQRKDRERSGGIT